MRLIVITVMLLALARSVAFAQGSAPFAVLQIVTTNGMRMATVQIAPGPKGIISVVPGARFGDVVVTRIDDDAVWLSDGTKVGIDPDLSYPYVHRYDALPQAAEPEPTPATP